MTAVERLSGKRVLVTGATGFIGGRLVERLALECGATVRALVSNFTNAARLARYPVEMVRGDVTSPADMLRAAETCDIIFHCAYGKRGTDRQRRMVTVGGTRNVLDAAATCGVERLVHTSTLLVYGMTVNGELDESAPRRRSGDGYADTKLEAEKLVFEYGRTRGVPVTVIQPTAVYGPFAPTWTVNVVETLKRHRVILVNGGDGLSNPVYIDDLVSALLLAACRQEAIGEAFLVSGGERIEWREFFGRFEAMLGEPSTVSMSLEESRAFYRSSLRRPPITRECFRILREEPEMRERILNTAPLASMMRLGGPVLKPLLRSLLKMDSPGLNKVTLPTAPTSPEKPIQAAHPSKLAFLAAKTDVSIDKARRLLGYKPAFDFRAGMDLTESWVRWANLTAM